MDNFRGNDRGGRSGGGFRSGGARGFKARSDGGGFDRSSRPHTMHSAVCSSCGKTCEVPFLPSGDKPVYCRDCFAGRQAMGGDRSNRPDPRGGNRFESNRGNDRPAPRFNTQSGGNDDIKRQLESINYKLDKLVTALIGAQKPQAPKKAPTVTVVKEKNTDSLKTIVDNATKTPEKKEGKKSSKKSAKKK